MSSSFGDWAPAPTRRSAATPEPWSPSTTTKQVDPIPTYSSDRSNDWWSGSNFEEEEETAPATDDFAFDNLKTDTQPSLQQAWSFA